MRPKKIRWVKCEPGERCFRPQCTPLRKLEGVYMTVDEFEAMRLIHLEGLGQSEAAKEMKVHRSTVSRILKSAHRKITDALVNIKAIKIEGGCCKIIGSKGKVIGVDMTPEMIKKARENAKKGKYTNVEFRHGEIESLPVETGDLKAIENSVVSVKVKAVKPIR